VTTQLCARMPREHSSNGQTRRRRPRSRAAASRATRSQQLRHVLDVRRRAVIDETAARARRPSSSWSGARGAGDLREVVGVVTWIPAADEDHAVGCPCSKRTASRAPRARGCSGRRAR
jgi:hypothetical protein